MFSIPCPTCKKKLKVKSDRLIGKSVACPSCGQQLVVTEPRHEESGVEAIEEPEILEEPQPQSDANLFDDLDIDDPQLETPAAPALAFRPTPQLALAEASEIARDGRYLVVPIEGARFPRRCVKTNKDVERSNFLVELDLLPQVVRRPDSSGQQVARGLADGLLGGAGGAMLDLANKQRLSYYIGLTDRLQGRSVWLWRIGLALVIASPSISMAISVLAAIIRGDMTTDATSGIIVIVSFAVTLIPGLVMFGMSTMGILQVDHSDGKSVWLRGAGSDFLDTLPEHQH